VVAPSSGIARSARFAAAEVAAADSMPPSAPSVWLPAQESDLDAPDRLEERDPVHGFGIRADRREGRWLPRHLWVDGAFGSPRSARLEWLFREGGPGWGTARIRPVRGVVIAGGAVVSRHPPSLLGEALGLARPLRAPRSPALGAPAFEAPRGPSSAPLRGAAVAASLGGSTLWGLAGRDGEGAAIRACGLSVRIGALAASMAAGAIARERRVVSLAAGSAGRDERIAAEVLLSPGRGSELLGEAIRFAGPLRVDARWRRRLGEARPVAGEVTAEWGSRALRTRVSLRPWSVRGTGDDGRIELEGSFRGWRGGPVKVRLGARGGPEPPAPDATRSERYVVADVGIARERGRSFSLLVSGRETRRAGEDALATAIGGRLELSVRGRAGATLVMQARRSVPGNGSGGAPAAWTSALAPSGAETIAARAGAGLAASGRAWVRLGGFRLEGLFSDAAAAEGDGSSAGSLRIEWERMEP
jgi:hypothetical protein